MTIARHPDLRAAAPPNPSFAYFASRILLRGPNACEKALFSLLSSPRIAHPTTHTFRLSFPVLPCSSGTFALFASRCLLSGSPPGLSLSLSRHLRLASTRLPTRH